MSSVLLGSLMSEYFLSVMNRHSSSCYQHVLLDDLVLNIERKVLIRHIRNTLLLHMQQFHKLKYKH
jgi:hypothetical protein